MNDKGLLIQLEKIGLKPKMLMEIYKTLEDDEICLGDVGLHLGKRFVCTNYRVISWSPIPFLGSTEWGDETWSLGKISMPNIVLMGGNFHILKKNLSCVKRAPTRHRSIYGLIPGHPVLSHVVKRIGPLVSQKIWPYEFQFVGKDDAVLDRIYGITSVQADEIICLATKAGLEVVI